jgi:hypothetical protein
MPEIRKEKPLQYTFAETPCYNMMLSRAVLPLVASMYGLGLEIDRNHFEVMTDPRTAKAIRELLQEPV